MGAAQNEAGEDDSSDSVSNSKRFRAEPVGSGFPTYAPRSESDEEGKPLPTPIPDATADADLIELVPLSVHVGTARG
jgi:hypothetical protein